MPARRPHRPRPQFRPLHHPQNPYYEVLGNDGLELLEHNADTILQEIGIDFRDDPEALSLFKAAGAESPRNGYGFRAACAAH